MTSEARKVTDLIKGRNFSYSFEVTPDVNKGELLDLDADPAFFSVTWHAKSHKCKDLEIEPLIMAEFLKSQQKEILMHLTCDKMRKQYLERVLAFLQEKGICNLFLVLGENFDPSSSDFHSTLELIKYIREISGHFFCIGIAGFCECNDNAFDQLKEKINAGANFIITQAFFEANVYKAFVKKSERAGIKVPILPGVFPFENQRQLTNFMNICKVKVSSDLMEYVNNHGGNKIVGAEIIRNLIQTISSEFPSTHFHFFTLNKMNNVCEIIKGIQKYVSRFLFVLYVDKFKRVQERHN